MPASFPSVTGTGFVLAGAISLRVRQFDERQIPQNRKRGNFPPNVPILIMRAIEMPDLEKFRVAQFMEPSLIRCAEMVREIWNDLGRSIKMSKLLTAIGVLIGLAIVGISIFTARNAMQAQNADGDEVNWSLLGELDYKTGEMSADLRKHDQKIVKIPGFVVPLEDDSRLVKEFLLVPTPQACVHVPPPPPNQMVFVKMGEAFENIEMQGGPVWVYGKLKISSTEHAYGVSSFTMDGIRVTPYN